MFRKANKSDEIATTNAKHVAIKSPKSKGSLPSVIGSDVHVLGNIISESSSIDFSGTIDGNIRCETLTLRNVGTVKGEISADTVFIHGTVKGLIRAKVVNLLASCKVEGIIIHEQLSIEDGAFVDGKFKRSDRVSSVSGEDEKSPNHMMMPGFSNDSDDDNEDEEVFKPSDNVKVLENIRLIR